MQILHTCQPQNFEKRETFLWVDFYLSCSILVDLKYRFSQLFQFDSALGL